MTAPTAWTLLEAALRQRRPVQITYHGHQRLICPHALGWKNGRALLLGYQTGGHTHTRHLPTDPNKRWRNFLIDDIDHIDPEPASPWQTAENYNPDRPFNTIDELVIAITPTTQPPLR